MKRKRQPRVDLSKIEILKGIPIPPKYMPPSWRNIFNRMEPTDSFVAQTESHYRSALRLAARLGVEVTSRKMEKGGWMIWKLK